MAEGLALAASVIAVLQITMSVLSVCYDYSAAAKDAPWELSQVVAEMESLQNVLQTLKPLAKQAELADSSAGTRLPTLTLLCGPRGLLQHVLNEVTRLEKRLKTPSWSDAFGLRRKAFMQALRWPLNKAETKEALVNIGRFKNTFTLAITADEVALTLAIQECSSSMNHIVLGTQKDIALMKDAISGLSMDVQSTQNVTLAIHQGMERERIHKWLSTPDPSTNHNCASRSRHADTGSWFLGSEAFTHWKEQNSLVWLHGKPGCGKTVLSSTIINDVLQESRSKSDVAVAYFYFDFNDVKKQKPDGMIQSLITQLSRKSTKTLDELESLFIKCDNVDRQPDIGGLMTVLKEVVESFNNVYIVLDALDECLDREVLMESIEQVQDWKLPQLHMLITSRMVIDIEESLDPLITPRSKICIQSALVKADILTYVHERLQTDQHLKRWGNKPKVQEEIKATLMQKADGMFRWAVCQLDALRGCYNLPMLQKALQGLPSTLDETYARMLRSIPDEHSEYAIKILQWLTYSEQPLRLGELAEVVAVNVNGSPWFDCDDRFERPQELLALCSSLVSLEDFASEEYEDDGLTSEGDDSTTSDAFQVVRLAHFSVKEYLVSERIRIQAAATARYAMQEIQANRSIAAACLTYLLQFDQHDSLNSRTRVDFPLALYAANNWMTHTRTVGKDHDPITNLVLEFCQSPRDAYINWYRIQSLDKPHDLIESRGNLTKIGSPLYYLSLAGVTELVRLLLDKGADVNAEGGHFGNALQAASYKGHEAVVQLLLNKGADVNTEGGYLANALQAASYEGQETVMQLLLNKGADVNAEGGQYGNALQAATCRGHETVVQLLLNKGAYVNAEGGRFGNALQAATCRGQETVVQLLLNKGADVNTEGGHFGNALQAATCRGHETVTQLLLNKGADVNAEGGHFGNALQAASYKGHEAVVQLLLNKGADVNAEGGYLANALQAASYGGQETVMQLLLNKGADVNAEAGQYGNALQAATCRGHETVVQLLLNKGAYVNAEGGQYGNALQAATCRGHETVMQLLLNKGADVNAEGGHFGNALQAASYKGHEAVVQLLLNKGADVNAEGGFLANALQAASYEGQETVVQLLLNKGANVNAEGGHFGNALQAASYRSWETLVQLLLNEGADVNAEGGCFGNALQATSLGAHEAVVQLLLNKGADVNAEGGRYGNALQAASYEGQETVVQLLVENGADVHAKSGKYASALEAALDGKAEYARTDDESEFKYTAVVQLLRSAMESQAPPSSPPTADEPIQLT